MSFFGVLDVAAVANHLSRHHEEIWLAYVAERDAKKSAQAAKKEADKENCEMENPELRFIDMRSRAGQVSFQKQARRSLISFRNSAFQSPFWLYE